MNGDPQSAWYGYWPGQYVGGMVFSTWRSHGLWVWDPQVLSDGQGGLLYGDMGFRTFVDSNPNVPEPATMLLLGSGLLGLAGYGRKRLKKN